MRCCLASVLLLLPSAALAQVGSRIDTRNIALRNAHLSSQIRKDILAVCADDSWISFPKLALNKAPIILISSGPEETSGTGNGDVWIFRVADNHAALILHGFGSMWSQMRSYHQGMRDFDTYTHGGGVGGVHVYRFDGRQYRTAYCYSVELGENSEKDGPHEACQDDE